MKRADTVADMDGISEEIRVRFREEVGRLAQRLLADEISWEEFVMSAPEEPQDEDIAELVDLLEHEPRVGGLLGVSVAQHSGYMERVHQLTALLTST